MPNELDMSVDETLKYIISMGVNYLHPAPVLPPPALKADRRPSESITRLPGEARSVPRIKTHRTGISILRLLSTAYLDIRSSPSVAGFTAGATWRLVIFIDLRDREGLDPEVVRSDRADMFQVAESGPQRVRPEDHRQVRRRRPAPGDINLVSGEIEVECCATRSRCSISSTLAPFRLDEETSPETTRLTHRVIDLRRPRRCRRT